MHRVSSVDPHCQSRGDLLDKVGCIGCSCAAAWRSGRTAWIAKGRESREEEATSRLPAVAAASLLSGRDCAKLSSGGCASPFERTRGAPGRVQLRTRFSIRAMSAQARPSESKGNLSPAMSTQASPRESIPGVIGARESTLSTEQSTVDLARLPQKKMT